jgi:5-methylcytosine-specific restriction protein A
MPRKPPTFCAPGQNVWDGDERARKAAFDKTRAGSRKLYNDAPWRKLRERFIRAHPVCCAPGCGKPTEDVDHILSVRQRPDLRLSWSNLRPFCRSHHAARTALDQGFARK